MPRTFIRQDTQVKNSDVYDDTVAAGSTMESGPTNIEQDFNNLRSQVKRLLVADDAGDWFQDVDTVNSKKRAVKQLNTDLDAIEEQRHCNWTHLLADIAVPAAQNFVVLSAASSQTPSSNAAVTANSLGAIVAVLGAGSFGAHSLDEFAGSTPISPFNLAKVRDAATLQPIQSGGRDVFALLQAENGVVDGDSFNDTDKRVQLSFVKVNAGGDDLEAVPASDIAGKTINYSFKLRFRFKGAAPDAFLGDGAFVDQVAAVDVTLDTAIDNQNGAATQIQTIEWRVADATTLDFQTADGARNLWRIAPTAAGDTLEANADDLDINTTNPADFDRGIKAATASQEIDIGVTAGVIESLGANDLRVFGAGELLLDDGNQSSATWVQTTGIKLSETAQEWNDLKTLAGEVSLIGGLVTAIQSSARQKFVAAVTSNIAANTAIDGSAGSPNIDAQLGDYSNRNFVNDVEIFINTGLMRNGPDAVSDFDVYPATLAADQQNGIFFAKFPLKASPGNPDVIHMFINGS